MSQLFAPLFGGELYENAARFASDMDAELSRAESHGDYAGSIGSWWGKACELGWPAMLVPEAQNGIGCGPGDLACLVEGGGAGGLRLPLIAACWVAPQMLIDADTGDARDCLAEIAGGSLRPMPIALTASQPASTLENNGVHVHRSGKEDFISGAARGVELVPGFSHYLIEAAGDDGLTTLLLLAADAPGTTRSDRIRLDGRLSADVSFENVPIRQGAIVSGNMSLAKSQRRHRVAAVLKCAEAVGAMGRVIEETVGYLKSRQQFGVELASFQALRHQVADLYVGYLNIHALTGHAALQAFGAADGVDHDVSLAKMRVGKVARDTAKSVIQLHGGMGMTEELFATRLNKLLLMVDFDHGAGHVHARHAAEAA